MSVIAGTIERETTMANGDIPILGDIFGTNQANAARRAGREQMYASEDANRFYGEQYQGAQNRYMPFYNQGVEEFSNLRAGINAGGFNPNVPQGYNQGQYSQGQYNQPLPFQQRQFQSSDITEDPGYNFTRDQGIKALQHQNAARGLGGSGNEMTGIADYVTGLAGQQADKAYGRFMDQQQMGYDIYGDQRDFGRGNFERDRNFGRGVYEGDRDFGYGQMLDIYDRSRQRGQDLYGQQSDLARYGYMAAGDLGQNQIEYGRQWGSNRFGGANAYGAGEIGASNARAQGTNNLLNLAMLGLV